MSCYHPIAARVIGYDSFTGKRRFRFLSDRDYVTVREDKYDYVVSSGFVFDKKDGVRYMSERRAAFQFQFNDKDFFQLPCRSCIGCQIDRSREWANRLLMELEYHDSAYFVTLTYDEFHVPTSFYPDLSTGEAIPVLTLRKKDVQAWMKRLRFKFSNDRIRYYVCGEYGPSTYRPHYHCILFGLHLDDLVLYKTSSDGFQYFNSASLAETWSVRDSDRLPVPLGYAVVAPVTWETCAYCARYVTKKMFGDSGKFYEFHNMEPPFSVMSLKPALGAQWYYDHPDCMDYDFINLRTDRGGIKFRPPGYFRKLYDLECPDESAAMKEKRRKFALEARRAVGDRTDLDYLSYLQLKEQAFCDRISSLKRDKV